MGRSDVLCTQKPHKFFKGGEDEIIKVLVLHIHTVYDHGQPILLPSLGVVRVMNQSRRSCNVCLLFML